MSAVTLHEYEDRFGRRALVDDELPEGTLTQLGSEDGVTSTHADIRDAIEMRRVAAAMHHWHAENPQWWESADELGIDVGPVAA